MNERLAWAGGILAVLVLVPGTLAQPNGEAGRPYLQTYGPKNYGAAPQNWAVVRDQRGLLYVGNTDGVLSYDGVSWRLIPTANNSVVRSLALDAANTIFVGAKRVFTSISFDLTN